MAQVKWGIRVDEFHGLSDNASFVHPAAAMKLQTMWDAGHLLLSLFDDRCAPLAPPGPPPPLPPPVQPACVPAWLCCAAACARVPCSGEISSTNEVRNASPYSSSSSGPSGFGGTLPLSPVPFSA